MLICEEVVGKIWPPQSDTEITSKILGGRGRSTPYCKQV